MCTEAHQKNIFILLFYFFSVPSILLSKSASAQHHPKKSQTAWLLIWKLEVTWLSIRRVGRKGYLDTMVISVDDMDSDFLR
jgi:hypothetical protein